MIVPVPKIAGGFDHCVMTYRSGEATRTFAHSLYGQMLDKYGLVKLAREELERMPVENLRQIFHGLTTSMLEGLQTDALRLARAYGDDPEYLNSIAWGAVYESAGDQKDDVLSQALELATHATRLRDTWTYHRTRGLVLFRLERFDEAQLELERAREDARADALPGIQVLIALTRARAAHADPSRRDSAVSPLRGALRALRASEGTTSADASFQRFAQEADAWLDSVPQARDSI